MGGRRTRLRPRPTHAQAEAQKEPTKTSEALVAELLTAKDGKIFFPAYMALVERIGKGGADAESAARLLLGHREEITVEPEVKVLLDTIVGDKKTPLAARLLLQIARAKNTVASFKKGEVVVGRVVLADGKLEPELVLAQMEILPDGYFAAEIGDMQRPLGLKAEGYAGVDVPIQGKAGSVIDTPVSSPDFFPTLLEAAGAKSQPGQTLDGTSLVPLLKGGTLPERALFWHYPHYGNQGGAPSSAVRRGDWKLVEWAEDNRAELFNLAQDIGEQTNLADKEPQRVSSLRAELAAWQKQVGAKFPSPNPNFDATKPNARGAKRNP